MSWIFRSLSSPLAVGVAGVGYSQPVSSIICPQSTVSIRQHIGREYDHYTLTWAPVKIPNTHIIIKRIVISAASWTKSRRVAGNIVLPPALAQLSAQSRGLSLFREKFLIYLGMIQTPLQVLIVIHPTHPRRMWLTKVIPCTGNLHSLHFILLIVILLIFPETSFIYMLFVTDTYIQACLQCSYSFYRFFGLSQAAPQKIGHLAIHSKLSLFLLLT